MKHYIRNLIGPSIVLAMFVAALWLLHNELRQYHLRDFLDSVASIPPARVAMAIGLTILNYAILIGYDFLGIKYIRHPMHFRRIALGSFLGYAVGNNFGTLLGGSTIRYRLYSSWGLSATEIVKLVLILGVTFWIGLFALAGGVFILDPVAIPDRLHFPLSNTRPLGFVLGSLAIGYLGLCAIRKAPMKIGRWEFSPPPLGLSVMQYGIAALDLMVATSVLYVLLPDSIEVSYAHFLTIYMLAIIASLVSQVPGGLGVMELVILLLLNPQEPHAVVGALLVYRLVYYFCPLGVGLSLLAGHEVWLNRSHAARAVGVLGKWSSVIIPRCMAFSVFLAGAILLLSGATPAAEGRMVFARRLLPLPFIEVSHLLGGIVGVLLLLLARGLQRRIDSAYLMTLFLLGFGVVFSLAKGLDYEEAIVLGIMFLLLLPCRRHFYRKGALFTERLQFRWFAAIGIVIACSFWLLLFAYRHVEYQDDMWWRFAFRADAPRSMRASVAAIVVVGIAGVATLLRSRHRSPILPNETELTEARALVAKSPRTSANLALLGDKHLLFNENRTGFLMYGTEGRSWVSMGDPVGDEDVIRELAWDYCELCDTGGSWPVFYQVDQVCVPLYVEIGLTLIKIGEEARVPLDTFDLQGHSRKDLRRTQKHLHEDGCTFEIIDATDVPVVLDQLEQISTAWMAEKKTAEKGFSMGFFQPDYIQHCPVALVRQGGNIIAFANLWCGADRNELSLDLMRYIPGSPHGVMEYLFIEILLWGRQQGYHWFNLGMAPLAGIDSQEGAPLWNQFAELTYRHGEHFYNFQGLRMYKDKFDPDWTPKYIASPGGWKLPLILTNVATLISGGVAGLIAKR